MNGCEKCKSMVNRTQHNTMLVMKRCEKCKGMVNSAKHNEGEMKGVDGKAEENWAKGTI